MYCAGMLSRFGLVYEQNQFELSGAILYHPLSCHTNPYYLVLGGNMAGHAKLLSLQCAYHIELNLTIPVRCLYGSQLDCGVCYTFSSLKCQYFLVMILISFLIYMQVHVFCEAACPCC